MFKSIINYLKQIANPNNGASEAKLFLALVFSLTYLLIASFVDLFTKWKPTTEIYFGVMGFVVTLLGIDTYRQVKAINIKGDIAQNIISQDSGQQVSDSAKDVLNSPKP